MFNIQTFNKISQKGLSLFEDNYSLSEDGEKADAIVLRSQKLHDHTFSPTIKAIGRAGAGVNNIPIETCTNQGIVVFNTPGANANAVKELVITGLLLSARDIYGGINYVNSISDKGDEINQLVEKNKSKFKGFEIAGKRCGVIGLGAIGLMVANALVKMGLEVEGYDPYLSVDKAWELSSEVKPAKSLGAMLKNVDFVTIHVPFSEKTKGILGQEELKNIKHGATLLNFSRDALIDEPALLKLLESGQVKSYVTDFPNNTMANAQNVIAIPHLGASTEEAEDNCAIMVARQLKDFLENGNITNSVNFPDCALSRSSGTRLIILNKNEPNMISQFTQALADAKLNIIEMVNKSRGDLAYNIIDVEQDLDDTIIGTIKNIPGVIRARILP